MTIESFEVGLNFGKQFEKNNQFSFQCPYNNQTNFRNYFIPFSRKKTLSMFQI